MIKKVFVIVFVTALIVGAVSLFVQMNSSGQGLVGPTPTLAPAYSPARETPMTRLEIDGDEIAASAREVLTVAHEQLPGLFEIASVDAKEFGMGPQASLEATKLLSPYPIYHLVSTDGESLSIDADILSHLELSEAWRIPVDWGDGPGALISISRAGEGWEVTGIGGRNTLTALQSALEALHVQGAFLRDGQPQASSFYYVSIYYKLTDVVIAETGNGLRAAILNSSSIQASVQGKALSVHSAPDALKSILDLP